MPDYRLYEFALHETVNQVAISQWQGLSWAKQLIKFAEINKTGEARTTSPLDYSKKPRRQTGENKALFFGL